MAASYSVKDKLAVSLAAHAVEISPLFASLAEAGKGILPRLQLLAKFESAVCDGDKLKLKDGDFEQVLKATQEAVVSPPWVALAIRPQPGIWKHVRVHAMELAVEDLSIPEFLKLKEEVVDRR